jgi:hypothetical protein
MKCLGKLKLKSLLWGSLQHSEIYFAIALLCNLTLTVGVVSPPLLQGRVNYLQKFSSASKMYLEIVLKIELFWDYFLRLLLFTLLVLFPFLRWSVFRSK